VQGVPAASSATFVVPTAFPEDLGDVLWEERRTMPVLAFYGVPALFLAALTFAVQPLAGRLALAAGALAVTALLVRAARRSLIETYVVSTRYLAVLQPGGRRAALALDAVTGVEISGDRVRIRSSRGTVTLGFVRHRRALVHALAGVVPGLAVDEDLSAVCTTCTMRY
jgi:hypothetical protein